VYSLAASAAGQFYSPGTSQGCRAEIQWEPWMTLTYRVESPAGGPHQAKDIHLQWTVEKPFADFAGFILVASQRGVPEAADDGVELFRWALDGSNLMSEQGSYDAWVSLEPVQRSRWSRFYCKLMTIDPAQRHVTLIVHPNTTLSYTLEGKIETGLPTRPVQGFEKGVPDKVICPYCFDEFPVWDMLFDSYEGGQARKAKYTAIDRALKREIAPPKDEHSRVLPVRLCPNNQHRLPWTAGTQTSLIIGLIGAKFSGKSHYIASLIAQLENQVGADMQAALLPVTDETQERYRREFYNPLFKNSLELAMTVGTPPPLIYDLTLDGRQWNEKQHRAVTLALYDTAGENLQDAAVARQMVQYLREASGIIFLVDPLQVPAVREMLPSTVQPPQLDADAAPYQIIANVLQLLERGKVLQANEPVSIPVAVVLTKCDVLAETGLIEPNRLWSTEKRHVGFYDSQAHNDMSGMMAEYFQRWNREAYNNIRLRFARHAFFGVSATGCASDPQTRRYKFISPWRVEDPLLWLLSELKVIQKG
jgi:GTPase SAR1 family protein